MEKERKIHFGRSKSSHNKYLLLIITILLILKMHDIIHSLNTKPVNLEIKCLYSNNNDVFICRLYSNNDVFICRVRHGLHKARFVMRETHDGTCHYLLRGQWKENILDYRNTSYNFHFRFVSSQR